MCYYFVIPAISNEITAIERFENDFSQNLIPNYYRTSGAQAWIKTHGYLYGYIVNHDDYVQLIK